jgi:hypothetical protein
VRSSIPRSRPSCSRAPLRYDEGADRSLDRLEHVRAGSSLAWVPGGIAVVQDDANFLSSP